MTVKERVNERFESAISMKCEIKDIKFKSTLEREEALISAANLKRRSYLVCHLKTKEYIKGGFFPHYKIV